MFIDLSKVSTTDNKNATLPDGFYTVAVTGAEVKETKSGDGKYIKVELTVTEGQYAKRKVWHMFNFENKNPKAVEIGLQDLKKMLSLSGKQISQLTDVTELSGLIVGVKTKTEDGYSRVHYFMEPKKAVQASSEDFPF